MIKPTKKQKKQLLNECHIGAGLLMMRTGPNECCYVAVYQSRRDGTLLRVQDGKPAIMELTEVVLFV